MDAEATDEGVPPTHLVTPVNDERPGVEGELVGVAAPKEVVDAELQAEALDAWRCPVELVVEAAHHADA